MPKPNKIDRHECKGLSEEEKYKDVAVIDYWWGLRELSAFFEKDYLTTTSGQTPTQTQIEEYAYLQILHYTVFINIAGAYYQIEQMQNLFSTDPESIESLRLNHFSGKNAFNALHANLYHAICALVNQIFTLLNRKKGFLPVKDRKKKRTLLKGLTKGNFIYWLNLNGHPYKNNLIPFIELCNNMLDIRHHITHFGYVPTYEPAQENMIYIQEHFVIGKIMTRFDLGQILNTQNLPKISILEASKRRSNDFCKAVDKIYEFIYFSGIYEDYMTDNGLKLKENYKPYWERDNLSQHPSFSSPWVTSSI